ncbi:uncharacterized protein LOC127767015 [Oryza glaberrima]|uniref:uncharacterized protein LOC127767015 n=1 Tax=Oryza glaberrima TaxID=4538 RepID=UPI00023E15F3|nr:uncharacterized protein LOC127767015 [Oryza glaberrima]
MASSSSSPPSWVVFSRVAFVSDEVVPGDVTFTLSQAPLVSHLTIGQRLLPEAITHSDPNNPSIIAVDPSGGLFLVQVILRKASSVSPISVRVPGFAATVSSSPFVASYIIVDQINNIARCLPNSEILAYPANAGILFIPSNTGGRFVVAQIRLMDGGGNRVSLLRFESHVGRWSMDRIRLPTTLDRFNPDCVLSHNGRLWWVDLSYGLISWDPLIKPPALSFIQLPPGKSLPARDPEPPDIHRHRFVKVSGGNLRFVDMDHRNVDNLGMRNLSVWTLVAQADNSDSMRWVPNYDNITFLQIWGLKDYKIARLPKTLPVLAFFHPKAPCIYFRLQNSLFGVDLEKEILVDVHNSYNTAQPLPNLVSSQSFHSWELLPHLPTLSAQRNSEQGGSAGGGVLCIAPDFLQGIYLYKQFMSLYHAKMRTIRVQVEDVTAYSGEKGQTMNCASQAMEHWNTHHGTTYELDKTEHMDSNAFETFNRTGRFKVELSYFHVNFYGKISGGEAKQLFFAELSGAKEPDNVVTVTALGHDENAIAASSGEHICICCSGLMHPYAISFMGQRVPTGTHQHQ